MPRRRAAIGLMAFCLSIALAGPGVPAEPVRLVMPVVYGTHLPGLGEPASRLAKLVKQLSGGTLELDLKQPGDGTQPQEILDKVSRGSVDAGFSAASFWAAKIPAAALFAGFPFGPDAKGYVEWFFAGNGLKLYQEMYDKADMDVHVIPCAFGGGEASGWFAKDIRSPRTSRACACAASALAAESCRGSAPRRCSFPAARSARPSTSMRSMAPSSSPPPSISASVSRITPRSSMCLAGTSPRPCSSSLINQDRWNALNDEQQTVLETACRSMLLTTLAESPRLQAAALAELAKQGVRIETWSDDLARAFRGAWEEVASEESSRDPFFRTVLSDIEKFRAGPEPSAPTLPPMPPAP